MVYECRGNVVQARLGWSMSMWFVAVARAVVVGVGSFDKVQVLCIGWCVSCVTTFQLLRLLGSIDLRFSPNGNVYCDRFTIVVEGSVFLKWSVFHSKLFIE